MFCKPLGEQTDLWASQVFWRASSKRANQTLGNERASKASRKIMMNFKQRDLAQPGRALALGRRKERLTNVRLYDDWRSLLKFGSKETKRTKL